MEQTILNYYLFKFEFIVNEIQLETKTKVLLVDNDPISQLFIKSYLKRKGYQVDIANDANEALILATEVMYEFTIIELVLPGKTNGLLLIKRFRTTFPKCKIFATSSNSDYSITEKVTTAGANKFLTKPFEINKLSGFVKIKN